MSFDGNNSNSNSNNSNSNSNPNSNSMTSAISNSQSEFLSGRDVSELKKESYKIYITKVLRQVHPELSLKQEAVDLLNDFCHDVFILIMDEANRLAKMSNKKTLDARDVQTAVSILFPAELSKHAISEGTKAVGKYFASERR